ncbi:MAG: hypothetical protein ACP5RI_04145 [Candidatus Micrarchaeia archaeon]
MDNLNIIFNKLGSIESSLNEIKENTKINTEDIKQLNIKVNELQNSLDFIYKSKLDRNKQSEISARWILVLASFINIGISISVFIISKFI